MSDLAERLRNRSFRLATRDFNGDGAKLAKEAADEIDRLTAALAEARDKTLEEAADEIMRHAKSEMPITVWKFNPWAKGRLDRITRLGPKWRAKAFIRAAAAIRALKEKP
jgi:hypothetical protein